MTMRKLACSFLITIIISMAFLIPFFKVSTFYSYAADSETWRDPTKQEQVEAFKYYCKSNNVTINGSFADALTAFTTEKYNSLCRTTGIDVDLMQSNIKCAVDKNGTLKFLYTKTGAGLMNRLFSEFLQNNDLSVGDTDVNEQVYSGKYFTDDNGNTCLMYIVKWSSSNLSFYDVNDVNYIDSYGTFFPNGTQDYFTDVGSKVQTYTIGGNNYNFTVNTWVQSNSYPQFQTIPNGITCCSINGASSQYQYSFGLSPNYYGGFSVFYNNVLNKYFIGTTAHRYTKNATSSNLNFRLQEIRSGTVDATDTNIYIYSPQITNNDYGDYNYTVINNDGDVYNYDVEPDPDPGEDPDQDPDIPYNPYPDNPNYPPNNPSDPSNPSDPYIPPSTPATDPNNPPSGDGGGTITFPDIDLNLPEINWSLGNLSEKFPFSIPFDLIAFFTVLNAEPEAPAIDADIPLGNWYTWHFEADFSQYDNWAALIRNVEFIAFCVGLIYLTVRFVKG